MAIKLRGTLYKAARFLGDVQAVEKGKVPRRIVRRVAGRVAGRLWKRIFK